MISTPPPGKQSGVKRCLTFKCLAPHSSAGFQAITFQLRIALVINISHITRRLLTLLAVCAGSLNGLQAQPENCLDCDDCLPRFAIKTNLVHDALVTPDLGAEISLAHRFSINVEGVYAWWSRKQTNRYWRIRGAWLEFRLWLGQAASHRALTGHHIGIYGSGHDYDFEFGGRGWQSPRTTYGVGLSYGYSFPIAKRLNLDLGLRVGYSAGHLIKYRPDCNAYVCSSRSFNRYFGLTGLEVTLVWFPGGGRTNHPDIAL